MQGLTRYMDSRQCNPIKGKHAMRFQPAKNQRKPPPPAEPSALWAGGGAEAYFNGFAGRGDERFWSIGVLEKAKAPDSP